ncbi:cyclic nucleotide-binding domain-containing protein [bacterium]|nr:cyclic nucleotide-binding domain-containing protein [bacterium]
MKQLPISEEQRRMAAAAGLPVDALSGLFALHFAPGESICTAGQPLAFFMLVLSGRAKASVLAENGRELLLCFSQAGDLIGDLELMLGTATAETSIRAITDVVCAGVPLARNRETLRTDTAFLNHAGAALAGKLRNSTENCSHIILYPLETRLCAYIAATARGGMFAEPLTETADLIGTSYRHLLRALERLASEGLIAHTGRGRYRILNAPALHARGKGLYALV